MDEKSIPLYHPTVPKKSTRGELRKEPCEDCAHFYIASGAPFLACRDNASASVRGKRYYRCVSMGLGCRALTLEAQAWVYSYEAYKDIPELDIATLAKMRVNAMVELNKPRQYDEPTMIWGGDPEEEIRAAHKRNDPSGHACSVFKVEVETRIQNLLEEEEKAISDIIGGFVDRYVKKLESWSEKGSCKAESGRT